MLKVNKNCKQYDNQLFYQQILLNDDCSAYAQLQSSTWHVYSCVQCPVTHLFCSGIRPGS